MKNKDVEKFVKKYADLVYRVAYTMLKNEADAEDIFQDVFMKLCTENTKFKSEEHKKAWIIRVTKNRCLDFLKSSANKNKEELDENLIGQTTDENKGQVLEEVMKLPEKYRIVIFLYYFEGYKISEISQILETNESTLKSQLVKAREILKDLLKEEF